MLLPPMSYLLAKNAPLSSSRVLFAWQRWCRTSWRKTSRNNNLVRLGVAVTASEMTCLITSLSIQGMAHWGFSQGKEPPATEEKVDMFSLSSFSMFRMDMAVLIDHISKEMNELNLIRCQNIPKRPDVDCHDLPAEKFVWMEAHQLTILTRVLKLELIIGWFTWRVNDGVKMSRLSFLVGKLI
ncbi:hypothetical protein CRYUN_Cryun01aG0083700 [Craigia yunnanensis]